jgi:hypothetical protein
MADGQVSSDGNGAINSNPELINKLRVSRNRLPITILFGAMLAFASFAYFSPFCSDAQFSSDAADYVRGAKIGFTASYFDTGSVGLWGSIKIMEQYPEARLHLWDFLEQRNDAAPNWHWHSAPGLYGAAIASEFGASNRTYRLIMAAAGAIAIGAVFIGLRLAGVHFLLALATAVLATVSPSVAYASSNVSPHAPFLAALITSGFAFAHYLERGDRAWGITTGVAFGFAVATCELSLILFAAFGMVLVSRAFQSGMKSTIKLLPVPGLALLGTAMLLWPGGVLRGGYGLSYGAWCLHALFRRGKDFGEVSPSVILTRGAQGSLLVVLVLVVIVIGALSLELTRNSNWHIQVFSWLVLAFFAQGMLNRFKNPTYAAHFIVVTWILLALISQQLVEVAKGRVRYAVLATVCGVYLLLAIPASRWPLASAHTTEEERTRSARAQETIALASRMIPPGATILGNYDFEIWDLYLPQNVVKHSTSAFDLQPRPWVKMPQDYWIIADPLWLTSDWRARLHDLSPLGSAGGFVIAHIGVRKN